MESNWIEQLTNKDIEVYKSIRHSTTIVMQQQPFTIYVDRDKLPDLIAALQSFLPKKTE